MAKQLQVFPAETDGLESDSWLVLISVHFKCYCFCFVWVLLEIFCSLDEEPVTFFKSYLFASLVELLFSFIFPMYADLSFGQKKDQKCQR